MGKLRTSAIATAIAVVVTMGSALPGAAAAPPTPGVSASTVRIGVPYVDFASLRALGVKLNQGSFPDAFRALMANINAHGGINGRRIVANMLAVNPSGTAASLSACTTLTEDDKVFAVMGPEQSDCYLQKHTPAIMGLNATADAPGAAPNFTLLAPASAYDPLQLSVFKKQGLFKGKKVGIFAGATTDEDEVKVVQTALKKLHVPVTQTAVDAAPASDQAASNQDVSTIAQRFQSSGISEVVAVGSGSATWPQALQANESTYNPSWIATSASALDAYIGSSATSASTYLKKVVTSSPIPLGVRLWQDPAIQKCAGIVRKAYPSDTITPPSNTSNGNDHSYVSVVQACQTLAIFSKIASAAGKNLTVSSFTRAGYGLRNVVFPGSGGPVSFGPGQGYALGPVFVGTYNATTHQIAFSKKSAT